MPRSLIALALVACTPLVVQAPPLPPPASLALALPSRQCAEPFLAGTSEGLAATEATATVVLDGLPSTFAVTVDDEGRFSVDRADLTVPPDQACPAEGACSLPLTVSLEGVVDGERVRVDANEVFAPDDDRTLRAFDGDGDGFAGPTLAPACPDTPGFADEPTDCDDEQPEAHPGHPPVHCDGLDNDCVGGEEHVKTLKVVAEGDSPEAQLRWALENVDDGGQVLLCDQTTFTGTFEVDGRVAAMGPLAGISTFVPDGGPALTTQGASMLLTRVAFAGASDAGCLTLQDSAVELADGWFDDCVGDRGGALQVDGSSFLLWRGGACVGNHAEEAGGCLQVDGEATLIDVELVGNDAPRGGALGVDGLVTWRSGLCEGNTADLGGCAAVGPGAQLTLGVLDGDPVVFRDNLARDQGDEVYVQGTLNVLSADLGPAPGGVVLDGGRRLP